MNNSLAIAAHEAIQSISTMDDRERRRRILCDFLRAIAADGVDIGIAESPIIIRDSEELVDTIGGRTCPSSLS